MIDTECERSRKYAGDFDFLRVDFDPPFRSIDFLSAVREQLKHKPAAIIVDTLSDEHEGEGGYREWHDTEVERVKNEWAAWNKPSMARQQMIRGFQRIKAPPLIFTFRAREKTRQVERRDNGRTKKEVVNIGWQPVTSLQVMHGLDLTCILPPRSEGVPVWQSDRVGEDFIIKLPDYLKPYIRDKQQLSEELGHAFASWAMGKPVAAFDGSAPARDSDDPDPNLTAGRAAATNGIAALREWWSGLSSPEQQRLEGLKDAELKPAAIAADSVAKREF